MPELPDVEGFRRELAGPLRGRRIRHVEVRDPGILRNTTAQVLSRRLAGHRFGGPRRHGKWLILPTDGPTLLVHSRMTGHPYHAADGAEPVAYERLVVSLDRGELRYADLRKLRGGWLLATKWPLRQPRGPICTPSPNIARIDGVAPGGQATFVTNNNQTNSAQLSAVPGRPFEANTVLADPNQAGMQVSIPWPYPANMHCEIDVDGNVAVQVDQFVGPAPGNPGPMNGVLPCGATLPG